MKYMVKQENGQQVLVPVQNGESTELSVPQNRLPAVPSLQTPNLGDHMLVPGQIVEIVHDITQVSQSIASVLNTAMQKHIGASYHEIIEFIEED